jgi:hypothetical protein
LYTPQNPPWDKHNPEDRVYVAVHKPWLIHFLADLLERGIDQLVSSAQSGMRGFNQNLNTWVINEDTPLPAGLDCTVERV